MGGAMQNFTIAQWRGSRWRDRLIALQAHDIHPDVWMKFKQSLIDFILSEIEFRRRNMPGVTLIGLRSFESLELFDRQTAANCLMKAFKNGFITPDDDLPGLFTVYPIMGIKRKLPWNYHLDLAA